MGNVAKAADARKIYSHQSLLDACKGLLATLPDAIAVPTATTAAAVATAAAKGEAGPPPRPSALRRLKIMSRKMLLRLRRLPSCLTTNRLDDAK